MLKIKELIKKNEFAEKIFRKIRSLYIALFIKASPLLATKYLYKRRTGKRLNLKNPRNFNEKIQWLKIYWQHPLVVMCGDKYGVRQYAEEIGCSSVLIESYGIYDNASQINWKDLPNKFALKVTNGCGYNVISTNKNKLNKKEVVNQLNKWIKSDYSLKNAEMHYSKMTPRIICEEFIETESSAAPIDYKIYCFNGKPTYILITPERETGYKRFFYDLEWNRKDFEKRKSIDDNVRIAKPDSLEDMINYAEKLAKPFPFVRVDFYDYKGKAILGEMTFTPAAGMATYYNEKVLNELGDMIELPDKLLI